MSRRTPAAIDPTLLAALLETLEAEAAYSERLISTPDEFARGRAAGIRLAIRVIKGPHT